LLKDTTENRVIERIMFADGAMWHINEAHDNFNFQLMNHAIMKIKFFSFFSLPKYTLIHVEHIVKNRRYTTLIMRNAKENKTLRKHFFF
jgi:mannosyltransferase OCH1-like enzyme